MSKTVKLYRKGALLCEVLINKGSKKKYTLQKEDYLILKFSLLTPIVFKIGDYIDDSEIGKYELTTKSKPTYDIGKREYIYELHVGLIS